MKLVTDPGLLEELESAPSPAGGRLRPVTDPDLLAELEGGAEPGIIESALGRMGEMSDEYQSRLSPELGGVVEAVKTVTTMPYQGAKALIGEIMPQEEPPDAPPEPEWRARMGSSTRKGGIGINLAHQGIRQKMAEEQLQQGGAMTRQAEALRAQGQAAEPPPLPAQAPDDLRARAEQMRAMTGQRREQTRGMLEGQGRRLKDDAEQRMVDATRKTNILMDMYSAEAEGVPDNRSTWSGNAKYYLGAATETLFANVLPAIGVGIITRSPGTAASVIGTQVYGQQYARSRKEGRTQEEASLDATVYALSESVVEVIPLGIALRGGGSYARRIFKGALTEGAEEVINEAVQILYDRHELGDDMTPQQVLKRLAHAGILGTMLGTGMTAVVPGAQEEDQDRPRAQVAPFTPEHLRQRREAKEAQERAADEARRMAEIEDSLAELDEMTGVRPSRPRPPMVESFPGAAPPAPGSQIPAVPGRPGPRPPDYPTGPGAGGGGGLGPGPGTTPRPVEPTTSPGATPERPPPVSPEEGVPAPPGTGFEALDATLETPGQRTAAVERQGRARESQQRIEAQEADLEGVTVPMVRTGKGKKEAFPDPRIKRLTYRQGLEAMADALEKGQNQQWQTEVEWDSAGDAYTVVTGRRPSQNPEWFKDKGWTVDQVRKAVGNAIAGRDLGKVQAEIVNGMLGELQTLRQRGTPEGDAIVDEAMNRRRDARAVRQGFTSITALEGDPDLELAGELYEESAYEADWDAETRVLSELARDALAIDEAAAEKALGRASASDGEVARELWAIITAGRAPAQESTGETQDRPGEGEAGAGRREERAGAAQGADQGPRTEGAEAEQGQEEAQTGGAGTGGERVEAAAAQAATSPENVLPEPSEAQKEAGNYQKGHLGLHGLRISIENPAGTRRRPEWKPLSHSYGYIRQTEGGDGSQMDVFLGPEAENAKSKVVIIEQLDPETGKFDEYKAMMGFDSVDAAMDAYLSNYPDGWREDALGAAYYFDGMKKFKEWLEAGIKPSVSKARGKPGVPQTEKEGAKVELLVRRFASGMSRPQDLRGTLEAGQNPGLEIGQVSGPVMQSIPKLMAEFPDSEWFIDSGAFNVFTLNARLRHAGRKQVVIEGMGQRGRGLDFDAIMRRYEALVDAVEAAGESTDRLYLVMPDVVGDQEATFRLLNDHMQAIVRLREKGAQVILPLQRGELSAAEALEEVLAAYEDEGGETTIRFGIPSNAEAMTDIDFQGLVEHGEAVAYHILGAASEKRLEQRLRIIREHQPAGSVETDVSADANMIRSRTQSLGGAGDRVDKVRAALLDIEAYFVQRPVAETPRPEDIDTEAAERERFELKPKSGKGSGRKRRPFLERAKSQVRGGRWPWEMTAEEWVRAGILPDGKTTVADLTDEEVTQIADRAVGIVGTPAGDESQAARDEAADDREFIENRISDDVEMLQAMFSAQVASPGRPAFPVHVRRIVEALREGIAVDDRVIASYPGLAEYAQAKIKPKKKTKPKKTASEVAPQDDDGRRRSAELARIDDPKELAKAIIEGFDLIEYGRQQKAPTEEELRAARARYVEMTGVDEATPEMVIREIFGHKAGLTKGQRSEDGRPYRQTPTRLAHQIELIHLGWNLEAVKAANNLINAWAWLNEPAGSTGPRVAPWKLTPDDVKRAHKIARDSGKVVDELEEEEAGYGKRAKRERLQARGDAVEYRVLETAKPHRVESKRAGRQGTVQGEMFTAQGSPKVSAKELKRATRPDEPVTKKGRHAPVRLVRTGSFRYAGGPVVSAEEAASAMADLRRNAQENMTALVLDAADNPLAIIRHSIGTIDGASVYPGFLLGAVAQVDGAARVWFAHNHPSGDSSPSSADKRITMKLHEILEGTGIQPMGMLMIAAGGEATLYDPMFGTGSPDAMVPARLAQGRRREAIAVLERKLRGQLVEDKEVENIEGPGTAMDVAAKVAAGREGLMLLTNRHRLIRFYPMSSAAMRKLRTGRADTGAAALLRTLSETNTAAVIAVVNVDERSHARITHNNLDGFFRSISEPRLLDTLYTDSQGGLMESAASAGWGSSTGTFQSARGEARAPGTMTAEQVMAAIKPVMDAWKAGPTVVVVDSYWDAAELAGLPVEEMYETIGMYLKSRDTVVLVAPEISDAHHAQVALAHEAWGHWAVLSELSRGEIENLSREVQKLKRSGNRRVREFARQVSDTHGELDAVTESMEIIAKMAEARISEPQLQALVRKAREILRRVLKSLGFTADFSDTDLDIILSQAYRAFQGQAVAGGALGSGALQSRQESGPRIKTLSRGQRRALDRVINAQPDPAKVRAQLKEHAGTPWERQAIEGALVRDAINHLVEGKKPRYDSLMNAPSSRVISDRILAGGAEAIWGHLRKESVIGHPSKPLNAVNSTYLNCAPSKACASYCYAVKGRNYPVNVAKQEMITWAVENDPRRLAKMTAEQYSTMAEFHLQKALRLFDKGDGDVRWLPYIEELNRLGVRVQVFSKTPEFLRQVPESNVRLLSVDDTNETLADQNPDLPLAVVWTSPKDNAFLEAHQDQVQVILPIKVGARTLDEVEIKTLPAWARKYTCPIDKGTVKIGTAPNEWNCTKCDAKMGLGCFHGQVTGTVAKAIGSPVPDDADLQANIQELIDVARTLGTGDRKILLEELDALVAKVRGGIDPAAEAGVEEGPEAGTVTDARSGSEVEAEDVTPPRRGKRRGKKKGGDVLFNRRPAPADPVDSAAFKRWFKDSKVVDVEGEPRRVYHATRNEFDAFERGDIGFHVGTAEAANDRIATFPGVAVEESDADNFVSDTMRGDHTLPLYASLQNPLWLPDLGTWDLPWAWTIGTTAPSLEYPSHLAGSEMQRTIETIAAIPPGLVRDIESIATRHEPNIERLATYEDDEGTPKHAEFMKARRAFATDVKDAIEAHGFDGIRYINRHEAPGSESFIAFHPQQLKSAVGNRGTFDPDDPRILFSRRRPSDDAPGTAVPGPLFYSPLQRVLEEQLQGSGTGQAYADTIRAFARKGRVKQEQLEWSGMMEWLDARKDQRLTKEQVLDRLRVADTVVEETVLSNNARSPFRDSEVYLVVEGLDDLDTEDLGGLGVFIPDHATDVEVSRVTYADRSDLDAGIYTVLKATWVVPSEGEWKPWNAEGTMHHVPHHNLYYLEDFGLEFDNERSAFDALNAQVNMAIRADRPELSEENRTQYDSEDYRMPGGEDYTELLIRVPVAQQEDLVKPDEEALAVHGDEWRALVKQYDAVTDAINTESYKNGYNTPTYSRLDAQRMRLEGEMDIVHARMVKDTMSRAPRRAAHYASPHWGEANVIAHARFTTRKDDAGKSVLFVEEIQSDWHQAGRKKGYETPEFVKSREKRAAERDSVIEKMRPLFEQARLALVAADAEDVRALRFPPRLHLIKNIEHYLDPAGSTTYRTEYLIAQLERGSKEQAPEVAPFVRELLVLESSLPPDQASGKQVPDAPFKHSWPILTMKRLIRWAADHGHDRIAWTTGYQQSERYGLVDRVEFIAWEKDESGAYELYAQPVPTWTPGVTELNPLPAPVMLDMVSADELPTLVGVDIADRILAGEGEVDHEVIGGPYRDWRILRGDQLLVGEMGMSGFYDRVLVKETNRYIKKWGARVGNVRIGGLNVHGRDGTHDEAWDAGEITAHGFDITPQMKAAALAGQPLFSRRRPPRRQADQEWEVSEEEYHGEADISPDYGHIDDETGIGEHLGAVYAAHQHGLAPQGQDMLEVLRGIVSGGPWYDPTRGRNIPRKDISDEDLLAAARDHYEYRQRLAARRGGAKREHMPAWAKNILMSRRRPPRYEGGIDAPELMAGQPVETPERPRDPTLEADVTGPDLGPQNTDPGGIDRPSGRHREYTQAQIEGLGKIAPSRTRATWRERIMSVVDRAKIRFAQGWVDQYRSLLRVLEDEYGWQLARMTHAASGAVEAALAHGKLFLTAEGAIDVDTTGQGLASVLRPLGPELDDFLAWVAANRAERLKREDRENLFTDEDIAAMKTLNQGLMEDGRDRRAVYAEALEGFNAFQSSMLDIAERTGLLDSEERATWEGQFYVPFYRLVEPELRDARGPVTLGGLSKQTLYKRLKGGRAPLNDLLANVLMNWQHLVSASLKNQAATRALHTAESVGLARRMEPGEKVPADAVWIRENGKRVYFELESSTDGRLVLESISALSWDGFNNWPMKVVRKFKRGFTFGVTASPEFRIANLMRDTVHAVATTPLSTNMVMNVVRGWQDTASDSMLKARMLASGGEMHFGHLLSADPEAARLAVRKRVRAEDIIDSPKKYKRALAAARIPLDWWTELGSRVENINRASLYRQTLARTGSHFQAAFEARDLIDFSQGGAFTAARFLSQAVPFLNARIQGLDKTVRAAKDPAQRAQLALVSAGVVAASLMLYLAFRDDEDFKEREQWDRDAYWWFKFPGSDVAYRIPRPFEVGLIGTLAERLYEAVEGEIQGVPGARELLLERFLFALGETLAFNPTPQAVQPLVELAANKDFFTGRPIETPGMERVSKQYRAKPWTSPSAQGLGKAMAALPEAAQLSPAQIDHLVEGYFAWAGLFVQGGVDAIVRQEPFMNLPPEAAWRLDEWPGIGRFVREQPARNTKYATAFYEYLQTVNTLKADASHLRRNLGRPDEARARLRDNRELLRYRTFLNNQNKKIRAINKQLHRLRLDRELTPGDKRARMDELQARKNAVFQRAYERTFPTFAETPVRD